MTLPLMAAEYLLSFSVADAVDKTRRALQLEVLDFTQMGINVTGPPPAQGQTLSLAFSQLVCDAFVFHFFFHRQVFEQGLGAQAVASLLSLLSLPTSGFELMLALLRDVLDGYDGDGAGDPESHHVNAHLSPPQKRDFQSFDVAFSLIAASAAQSSCLRTAHRSSPPLSQMRLSISSSESPHVDAPRGHLTFACRVVCRGRTHHLALDVDIDKVRPWTLFLLFRLAARVWHRRGVIPCVASCDARALPVTLRPSERGCRIAECGVNCVEMMTTTTHTTAATTHLPLPLVLHMQISTSYSSIASCAYLGPGLGWVACRSEVMSRVVRPRRRRHRTAPMSSPK